MFMIDIETLGTSHNALILSIGAVQFNDHGTYGEVYLEIDPASANEAGLKIDPMTVLWWMKQSDEARSKITHMHAPMPLRDALQSLAAWMDKVEPEFNARQVWGNASTFDNVILGNAFKAVGLKQPWPFWGDRCYRTLKNLVPQIPYERTGTAHAALDDARSQARHAAAILQALQTPKAL